MLSCWSHSAGDRPSFYSLEKTLEVLLENKSGYLKLTESLKWKEQNPLPPLSPDLAQIDELEMENMSK